MPQFYNNILCHVYSNVKNIMAILEEILAVEVHDVFGKLVDGLSKSLSNCKGPTKDYMDLFLTFLRKQNSETVNVQNKDTVFCIIVNNLLHALKHEKESEGSSAFKVICNCIAICVNSSKRCGEILSVFLVRNIQNYVTKMKENIFSFWEESEDILAEECEEGMKAPISSVFRLLLELSNCLDASEGQVGFDIFDQEIFNLLLQVLAVGRDDSILVVVSQIMKLHLIQSESKKKELFAKMCEIQCQGADNNVVYAVVCLLIDELLCCNEYDIRNEEKLRWFIQNGLASDDLLTRKRAMYILKKIVDVTHDKFKEWSKLNDFILLFETLEEKQLHVISPVLPMVYNILEMSNCGDVGCKDALHFSWLSTVLVRALNHDNRFITRWAIDIILDLRVKEANFFHCKNWFYIIDPLFYALKEYYLFEKENGLDIIQPPSIVVKLNDFLLRCQDGASVDQQVEFFRKIIESLCSTGYNAVAFPYIAETVSTLTLPGVVDSKLLSLIKTWMLSETSTFPTELKIAAFHLLLKIVTNCLCKDEITLAEFVKFLKVISEQDVLIFESELWCSVITTIRSSILSWKLQHELDQNIESLKNLKEICESAVIKFLDGSYDIFETTDEVGLMIFITIDVISENEKEAVAELLGRIMELCFGILTKFGRNPYLCEGKLRRCVSLAKFMLNVCIKGTRKHPESQTASNILEKLLGMSKVILSVYRIILENIFEMDSASVELARLCYDLNVSVCDYVKNTSHVHFVIEHMMVLLKVCTNHMKNIVQRGNFKSIFLIFKSLEMVSNMVDGQLDKQTGYRSMQLESALLEIIQNINLDISLFLPFCHSSRQGKKEFSDDASFLIGNFIKALWTLILYAIKKEEVRRVILGKPSFKIEQHQDLPLTLSSCNINELVDKILEAIDVSVGNDMIPLLHCLECLMPDIMMSSMDLTITVLESVWRLFKEQERRDSRFWQIFVPCVNVLFHKSLLFSPDKVLLDKVTEFWRFLEDVGQKKSGMFNMVVSHCCTIWEDWLLKKTAEEHCKSMLWCIDLLVDACTFGNVQKKAARIMQQSVKYFSAKLGSEREVSKNVNVDYQVRWTVTNMLSKVDESSPQSLVVNEVMKRLIEKDRKISEQVKRYYDNSITHRQKLRIWQTMLTLVKFIKEENADEIISKALSVMVSENQPSIRYYIEWFIVVVINRIPSLMSIIWQKLSEASERRVCSVTCLMSIIMHVTVVLPDSEFSEMAAEAFTKILPWVQIHHMQARVHAQIVIRKLWEELKRRRCDHILKEYRLIESLFSLNEGNASVFKARNEIQNHFYFKIFHPIKHFSIETIYCSMPKLLNIGEDELLSQDEFVKLMSGSENLYGIEVYNKSQSLFDLVTRMSQNDEVTETKRNERSPVTDSSEGKGIIENGASDVQKKIVAWKPLPPTEDPFLQKSDIFKKELRKSELVLCASLVDRTPNLGGLCRTSEIFGVSTMVIGAMRYLDDLNFKSLSVTAEKWINIEQILPRHLEVYLKEMKGKGYRLVGIEQTAKSKSLECYKFHEKTLLLLGNEREGIPVELIQILDDCVEIPQQGVIRSLNVHVSGAIITWEYCRQKLLGQHNI